MIWRYIEPIIRSAAEVITNPRQASTRWQKTVRFGYDLGRHGWRQLRDDNAPMMAAALTFRTLFALLPVIVVTTVVVKAMYGVGEFKALVGRLIDSFYLDDVQVVQSSEPMMGPPWEGDEPDAMSLGEWVEMLVDRAAEINLEALGWVGLAIVIYAAISLMATIEATFNTISRAPQGRAWTWRVPLYWFLLTLGPVAIGLTYFVDARFTTWISDANVWPVIETGLPLVWTFCASWLLMTLIYMLVPNTSLSMRAVLAGAFVAALLIEIGKRTLGAYISNAFTINQLYGSLGLIPVFMFWTYLMWLVVLFGLEVTAALHMLGGRRELEEIEQRRARTGFVDPTSVLAVMQVITSRFQHREDTDGTCSSDALQRATGLNETIVRLILGKLVENGYIHRVSHADLGDTAVVLARPPEDITVDGLLRLGYDLAEAGGVPTDLGAASRLRDAQLDAAGQLTLADAMAMTGDDGTSAGGPASAPADAASRGSASTDPADAVSRQS